MMAKTIQLQLRRAARWLLLSLAAVCGSSLAAAPAWRPVGISGGGAMFAPAISPADPNMMMLNCDMSGVYISDDGGHNWNLIHHAQLQSDIECRPAFHPSNPNTIYASSNGRLKISRDRGKTFEALGNLKDSLGGEIAINPSDPKLMLAGSRSGRCWISHDAGETWTSCSGPTGKVMAFHFDQTKQGHSMFAATDKGIWRSDDDGESWVEKTQGLPWKQFQGFAGGSDAADKLAMLYCSIESRLENGTFAGGLYRSRDRGETWESAMGKGLNTETKKADEWAYGSISQYHQLLTTDAKPLTVYAFNTSTGFHPPHSDTVYRSDDGGETWRATYFQDPRFENYNVSPDWETASCGKSFKGGETPFGVAICNSDPERVMLVRNEPHITRDGGKTWFGGHTYPATVQQQPGPGSSWFCNGLVVTTTWHFYTDPFQRNRQYICYTDIGFARSTNSGQSWTWWEPKTWAPWRNTCYELAFDPSIPGKIWGAFSDVHDIPNDNIVSERHGHKGPGGVCVSPDFGASWKSETEGLPARPVTSIVVDPRSPANARTLYAGVFEEGVLKSSDDGRTWTLKKTGLGHPDNMRVYRVILHEDGTLFASICGKRPGSGQPLKPEGVGLYRSTDRGETWDKINISQPLLYPKDFTVDPHNSRRILFAAADADRGDQSGGLYLTEDRGQTWHRIGREGPQTFGGYFHPRHNDWIYMALTEGAPGAGLWLSRDNGESWQPFNDLPFSNIQRVEFDPADDATIHVTTFGASVWRGPAVPAGK
jgi:photosystem II stability/assembly factor-like uncharacterized protein